MKQEITKEYSIELIGMADLLEGALNDMKLFTSAFDARSISFVLRDVFNKLYGEEELAKMRGDNVC